MDHSNDCEHLNCSHTSVNKSVCQTLSEMDWERGLWYAAGVHLSILGAAPRRHVLSHTSLLSGLPSFLQHQHSMVDMWEKKYTFNGDKERVQTLIDKARNAKEAVNAPDNGGYTALHYAARSGYVDICKLLLSNGADINAQTSGKATPLHKAAAAGKFSSVKFLIQSGACVNLQDVDGQTALHKAVDNKRLDLVDVLLQSCPQLAHLVDNKGRFAIIPSN